jgi:hypothetical protein
MTTILLPATDTLIVITYETLTAKTQVTRITQTALDVSLETASTEAK